MSAVTLATLRSEFEAAIADWKRSRIGDPVGAISPDDVVIGWFNDDHFMCSQTRTKALRTAHTYVIGRDYGLEAAMLYKLSDGALDPREVQ